MGDSRVASLTQECLALGPDHRTIIDPSASLICCQE